MHTHTLSMNVIEKALYTNVKKPSHVKKNFPKEKNSEIRDMIFEAVCFCVPKLFVLCVVT